MPEAARPVPDDNLQTWRTLTQITDRTAFQLLCDETLAQHQQWGYDVRRIGVGTQGTIAGSPDSWGYDKQRRLCAFEYGSSAGWETKLKSDLESVRARQSKGFDPEVFVFCTNRGVPESKVHEYRKNVPRKYGWELQLIQGGDLAIALDTDCQDIRARHLGIELRQHTWTTLLAHCRAHLQRFTTHYHGKYHPDDYVPRKCEDVLLGWYRNGSAAPTASERSRQLAFLVGQAGTGKSSLVLHVAETLAQRTAVILLPGGLLISDGCALERAIVDAAGYPASGQTFHASLDQLCQLAGRAGERLLIVIDAVNERGDPAVFRTALKQLMMSYAGRPLLVLVTCRDAMWWHIQDPVWEAMAYVPDGTPSDQRTIILDVYDDEEFHRARSTYFRHHGISAELASDAVHVLRSPLLLGLFSSVYARRGLGVVQQVNDRDLWEEYLRQRLADTSDAIGRRLAPAAVRSLIHRIAERMLDAGSPQLMPVQLDGITYLDLDDTSPKSVFVRLKDAGVLMQDDSGAVRFVYERCLEHVLARLLADRLNGEPTHDGALGRLEQLAVQSRWRFVALGALEQVADPAVPLTRVASRNLWLAAAALERLGERAPATERQDIVTALIEELNSHFAFDRARAAGWLGRLYVFAARVQLVGEWHKYRSRPALLALARLGEPQIIDDLVRYLGRQVDWYWAEDEKLISGLPASYREALGERAIALLEEPKYALAAGHALGYLGCARAVGAMFDRVERSGWVDGVALVSLLKIGTTEALQRLGDALGEIASRAAGIDHEILEARSQDDSDLTERLTTRRNRMVSAIGHVRVCGFQRGASPAAVRFLIGLVGHEEWYVRSMAVSSLGYLRAGEATEAIVRTAGPGYGVGISPFEQMGSRIQAEPLIAIVEDPTEDASIQQRAIEAIGCSQDVRALPLLLRLVQDRQQLFSTVMALGRLQDARAIPALENLLSDTTVEEYIRADVVPIALGKIGSACSLQPLHQLIRVRWPSPPGELIEAYVYIAHERAIDILRELWLARYWNRSLIVSALRWIGGSASVDAILDLIGDEPIEAARGLAATLWLGTGLGHFGGTSCGGDLDDKLVAVLEQGLTGLHSDEQLRVVWALRDAATPESIRLLEWMITSEAFDGLAGSPGPQRTVGSEAVSALKDLGSPRVLNEVIDELSGNFANFGIHHLSKMPRGAAIAALCARLDTLPKKGLVHALQLLGWMGDSTALDDVRRFIRDRRTAVADAAHEAEQRLLGLADVA